MINETTYHLFYLKFTKNEIITTNLLVTELKISRPTAIKFIRELVEFKVIEIVYQPGAGKYYKIIK